MCFFCGFPMFFFDFRTFHRVVFTSIFRLDFRTFFIGLTFTRHFCQLTSGLFILSFIAMDIFFLKLHWLSWKDYLNLHIFF